MASNRIDLVAQPATARNPQSPEDQPESCVNHHRTAAEVSKRKTGTTSHANAWHRMTSLIRTEDLPKNS